MDKIINETIVKEILSEAADFQPDFKRLIRQLYFKTIHLDILDAKLNTAKKLHLIRHLERVSLYIFANYTKIIGNNYDRNIISFAMQVISIAFEKIGDYVKHYELAEVNKNNVLLKVLRCYLRSGIAATLADNAPNSIVLTKKINETIRQIDVEAFDTELRELYKFMTLILSRHFNTKGLSGNNPYTEIIDEFRKYINSGDELYYYSSIDTLESLTQQRFNQFKTSEFQFLYYARLCLEKIRENCVWTLLGDQYTDYYIRQLIKSRPSVIELWPNQAKLMRDKHSFLNDDNINRIVISLPTSGGKSLLAELLIVRELQKDNSKKCIYVVPTNALTYEVSTRLKSRFRRLNYKVSLAPGGYETEELDNEANVFVMTPEKLETAIRNNNFTNFLDNISLIIFDEFHKISELERGWTLESCVWYLISHTDYKNIKLMILSAVMDNKESIFQWINSDNEEEVNIGGLVGDPWKPTVQLQLIVNYQYKTNKYDRWIEIPREHRFFKENYRGYFADAVINFIDEKKRQPYLLFEFARYHNLDDNKVNKDENFKLENLIMGTAQMFKKLGGTLIFFNTKHDCEQFISDYAPIFPEKLELKDEVKLLIKFIEKRLGSNHLLIAGLKKGIAYHHGSLPIDIREALEEYFSNGYISIIVCTTTLADGINFPIQNFIYTGKKYSSQKTIDIADFRNIVGRAGRAYRTTYGQIIHIDFFNNLVAPYIDYQNTKNIILSSVITDASFNNLIDSLNNPETNNNLLLDYNHHFFMTLMTFFISGFENEELIEPLLKNTLFANQIEADKLEHIISASKRIYHFSNTLSQEEKVKIVQSGLSVKSYRALKQISDECTHRIIHDENISNLNDLIRKDYFQTIISLEECRPPIIRRSTPSSKKVEIDHYNFFLDWVDSELSITELVNKYFVPVNEEFRMSRNCDYIKDMFDFKLPWILGTLSKMMFDILSNYVGFERICGMLYNLPMFIKYGVNTLTAVNLARLGMNSRETIKEIASYIDNNITYGSMDELRNYLKDLDPQDIQDYLGTLTEYEIRKLISLSNNYKETSNFVADQGYITTHLASTRYNLCRLPSRDEILNTFDESRLALVREPSNFYDEMAVAIYYDDEKIGYVPRMVNEEIAYYLDLNYTPYIEFNSVDYKDPSKYIELIISIYFDL